MTTPNGRLAGKVAFIVGAGQTPGSTIGNGRAIATLFAAQGARVVCADRDRYRAEETANSIVRAGGEAVVAIVDITDNGQCHQLITDAIAAYESVDVLVNNVGIGLAKDGPAHIASEQALDLTLDVNLKGAWRMIEATLPTMRAQRSGSIVNISSLASLAGGNQVAYEISKAGMNRLTTSVAKSQAKHMIRCNAVLPGFIDTPMAVDGIAATTGRPREEVKADRDAMVPLGRQMGTAYDTANAALFLASDEAKFITGALLPVDGGMGLIG